MTRSRLFILLGVIFLLLLGAGAGAWYYLYGANRVSAAELVPGDTVAFATIPNAAVIATGYQTSQLKQLVDSPNAKPLSDAITKLLGQKTLDVLNAFWPNLSGQSFLALTSVDPDHPEKIGFIAGMKPKPGLGNFDDFVQKLKDTWPDLLKQGSTGTGNVVGVDYQWIKGPNSPDKLCVAKYQGWIITTYGEAALQDWIERLGKKSATPSLAENSDYQKSLARVGKDPMAVVYLNCHAIMDLAQKQLSKTNPAQADYMSKKFASVGGLAIGTRFENGEIVDRFSFFIPHDAQADNGFAATPCPFDTLKFTGPDTRLYFAASIDWKQYWKNFQEQMGANANPMGSMMFTGLQNLAQSHGLDLQKNVIDPLGGEVSIQSEWPADSMYPELGLFVKLDKPDDFKPTITAIITAVRQAYINSAVIKEVSTNGHNFASLQFVQASPISPTITEDGPYLGIFMSPNQAVRSFTRDETLDLLHNADFTRQIGDKRNGASELIFFDSPKLFDRAYQTAMPYLSMLSMFNKTLAAAMNGQNFPPDLAWLAPMGTWSCVVTPDDDGVQAYSVSGVGNQGILLAAGLGAGVGAAESMGLLPQLGMTRVNPPQVNPAPAPAPVPPPISTSPAVYNTPAAMSPLPSAVQQIPTPIPTPEITSAPTLAPTTAPTEVPTPVPSPAIPTTPDVPSPTPTPTPGMQ